MKKTRAQRSGYKPRAFSQADKSRIRARKTCGGSNGNGPWTFAASITSAASFGNPLSPNWVMLSAAKRALTIIVE
jgi:hypothetical protein